MSAPSNCCNSCTTVEVINVPGIEGEAGSYAFSLITGGGFNLPGALGVVAVNIPVDDTGWMAVGQYVFIEGGGIFQVDAVNSEFSFNAEWLDVPANTSFTPGAAIAAGAKVSPSGPPNTSGVHYDVAGGGPEGVVTALRPAICYDANGNFWYKTGAAENNTGWVQFIAVP